MHRTHIPAVFTDDDGQSYLYWGNGHGYVVPLDDGMVSFDASRVKDITPDGFREGSFVVKRDGTYYFIDALLRGYPVLQSGVGAHPACGGETKLLRSRAGKAGSPSERTGVHPQPPTALHKLMV